MCSQCCLFLFVFKDPYLFNLAFLYLVILLLCDFLNKECIYLKIVLRDFTSLEILEEGYVQSVAKSHPMLGLFL